MAPHNPGSPSSMLVNEWVLQSSVGSAPAKTDAVVATAGCRNCVVLAVRAVVSGVDFHGDEDIVLCEMHRDLTSARQGIWGSGAQRVHILLSRRRQYCSRNDGSNEGE